MGIDRVIHGLFVQLREQFDGSFDKSLTETGGAPGTLRLVIPFGVAATVGDVADVLIRQLDEESMRERRTLFDGQAQLDEDLSGQAHPSDVPAQRDHLHLDAMGLPFATDQRHQRAGAGGGSQELSTVGVYKIVKRCVSEAVKKLAKGSKSQIASFDNQPVAKVIFHDFQFFHTFSVLQVPAQPHELGVAIFGDYAFRGVDRHVDGDSAAHGLHGIHKAE